MKVLSRNNYDIRFLKVPGRPGAVELAYRIENEVRRNFPGNHDQYLHFFRPLGGDHYITAIIKKDVLDGCPGETIALPSLLLPEIIKKGKGPLPKKLVILAEGEQEEISFDDEGSPVSSRFIDRVPDFRKDPGPERHRVIVSSHRSQKALEEFSGISDESLYLKKPVSPKGGRINRGRHTLSSQLLFLLLLPAAVLSLLLLVFAGISNQEVEIKRLKRETDLMREAVVKKADLLEEITLLTEEVENLRPAAGPYTILSTLYKQGGGLFSITGTGIEKNSFTLEAMGPDPMILSAGLTDSGMFSDIDILKISRTTDEYSFSIRGNYNE